MAVLINEKTKVLIQGITGREAVTFTRGMLDYGTKVVAGVTPGKEGQQVYGVPVYNCVKTALKNHKINTTIVSVPPGFAKDATFEAIDAGIKLINVFTERIPRADVIEMVAFAKQRGARIIGPNSLGMISPGEVKLGSIGGPMDECDRAFTQGNVAVLSRSGGMLTETCSQLSLNGIGQSIAINIGGDPIIGSTFYELLPLLEKDPQTKAVVLFCEPGTVQEETTAKFVKETSYTKPIVAFIAGRFVDRMPGMRFGHAAVIVHGEMGSTKIKARIMREAGIRVVDFHSQIAGEVRKILEEIS
ncbi:MAG: succinate--CoA ligase subunit alpha [Candidatus Aerophobetes bacterium]|nr:succinate--CoA ligase subunit alpha [Candidatus Aerophobetes bacterium]